MPEYILKADNIQKSFAGVKALKGVNLEIEKGEIHCLAGENGCGKSTLIKIISGVYEMDSGELELNGIKYEKITPIESILNGVQVIYQDLSVFPNLSVMENLAFNTELSQRRKIANWKRFKSLAQEAIQKIDFHIDLKARVSDLSIADKQLIAICRALMSDARLIIMDEPTTALTKREVNNLFRIIKNLQSNGISILFVSHKLDEVFEISDRFTILRNGENVITGNTSELDNKSFSYYMTGRHFEETGYAPAAISKEPLLKVEHLSLKNGFDNISFELYPGEILGITGLLGSGRTELALALFGYYRTNAGEIRYRDNKKLNLKTVNSAIKANIGYVPEDRLTEGLFLPQSIGRNVVIGKINDLATRIGILKKDKIHEEITEWVGKLSIATPDPENAVQTLSGGNQQRVVLAKWMARKLDVLILNGPTVGVDIGSKHDIHEILKGLAQTGIGLIVISDDLPEIMTLCNRVLIMKRGVITAEFLTSEINEKALADEMTGVAKQ